MRHSVGLTDRLLAGGSILLGLAAVVLAATLVVDRFPVGILVLLLLVLSAGLAVAGLIGGGWLRAGEFAAALLVLLIDFVLMSGSGWHLGQGALTVLLIVAATAMARRAFSVRVPLPDASPPDRPVLFFNPKSGEGKAERFNLASEAEARGIRAIELTSGADLGQLVRQAVDDGADALAMAGGDGSQAIVAGIAAEFDLPYVCVPAGTRNHFALDLGVDRDDVAGSLDALVDAGERLVDLAEVNGRVFVNNVSLGVYAEAVRRDEYREAKIKTLLETVPQVLGQDADLPELEWRSPSGKRHHSGAAILVSNNRYRLGKAVGSGTRPKIDDGKLGVAVLADPVSAGSRLRRFQMPWRDWSAGTFEVGAEQPVAAGIDGEATTLEPPLKFTIRPGVLRVRIARRHPGASPSAAIPDGLLRELVALVRIALGRPPTVGMVTKPHPGKVS